MDSQRSHDHVQREWDEPARKRMRMTPPDDDEEMIQVAKDRTQSGEEHNHIDKDKDKSITIASTAKLAPQTVAPFLAKHIPAQYAPLGDPSHKRKATTDSKNQNSKFCYRHRPDMLCRRQADEPSMELLQQNLEALPQEDRQGIVQVWSLFSAAPSRHRNLMLQGILAQCCFPQLSYLSTNVRELIRIDFIAALPSEIAFKILCFLDTISLCKAAQVSRKWRQLADDDVVWHRMCEQHIDRKCNKCGWGLPLLERKRLRATKRQIQLRASGQGGEVTGPFVSTCDTNASTLAHTSESSQATEITKQVDDRLSPALRRTRMSPSHNDSGRRTRPWKDVYKDRFRVGTNWKHGRHSLKILKGHTNGVMSIHMYDNILATGSYDDTIKIWDLETGEELRTLIGHTMGIRCLQLDDTKLISGSLDKTLKVWNWRTGECVATYNGHAEGVIGLHFDSSILVSGSIDRTARVWNFKERSVFSLRGHEDWVNAVRIDTPSQTVFTASDDCTVRMWDLTTRTCIHTFLGHVCQVQQVVLLPPEFDTEDAVINHDSDDPGSPDSENTTGSSFLGHSPLPMLSSQPLSVSASSEQAPSFADPFVGFDEDRPRPPKYMLTSALDSTIRLWEVHTGRCVRTFFGHLEGVWALAADTLRIVSGAEDRMVKVWDPRSGKCERTFGGHRGPVTCVSLSDSRLVSAGEDGEIRVHCFNSTD